MAISPRCNESWTQVSDLFRIQSEQDYDRAVERLNTLHWRWAPMNGIRSILCLIRLAQSSRLGRTTPCHA